MRFINWYNARKNDLLNITDSEYQYFIKMNSTYHDFYPIIWKQYEKDLNYLTIYNEDFTTLSAFHYLKKGFYFDPAAIYNYPFWSRYEQLWSIGRCKNTVPCYSTMVDMVKLFVERLNSHENTKQPYFFNIHVLLRSPIKCVS